MADRTPGDLARVDPASGKATVLEPPTPAQGARRVWSDAKGRLWVSEWNAGRLGRDDPAAGRWREWPPPTARARSRLGLINELADHVR